MQPQGIGSCRVVGTVSALFALAAAAVPALAADSCPLGADLCPDMVQVASGSFDMGSPATRDTSERPVHHVTLKGFRMSRTPVTFDQWDACVKDGGCINGPAVGNDLGAGRGKRPVSYVTYANVAAYTAWLGARLRTRFRLPSEAEYEYAARAGSTTRYPWGDQADASKAAGDIGPVGRFPANAFGLYDMSGNIAELTSDCWHGSYEGAPADGSAWVTGCLSSPKTGLQITVRGALLNNGVIADVGSAVRQSFGALERSPTVGFRVVQDNY